MATTLLNYRKGISKSKGNPYWCIEVSTPCTPADNANGCFGMNIDTIFVDENIYNKLSVDMIGKEVDFKTSGFGRRVHIDEINVVK